ncbi:MAG: ABC transporter ATP-binding protein [Acidimicrobiia bacterium]|nr:ABC transporter ATP-binding protein [Acidimicrobiia bacterium]MDH5295071.1 ABC transporter ATP-binding protein [Acidimicrobiia bacterium]
MTTQRRLLEVENLTTHFFTRDGVVRAVDGISFGVDRGEVLGIVGESGCGKSITSLSIMGLIPHPGKIVEGSIEFDGRDLATLSKEELRSLRGDQISMIFQQPTSSLNPVYRVGAQISEVFELHRDIDKKVEEEKAIEMLSKVGIPDPGRRARAYPHEMSGGMAQRVMIAMALALEPQLLIADEPTTALDVTIQAQILDLMRDLRRDFGTAVILITHDLGVVAEMADRVAVMYAGKIVEETDVRTLFRNPKHPYTVGLIGSIPVLGEVKEALDTIPGVVPSLVDLAPGCRFASRCVARLEQGLERCTLEEPPLIQVGEGHKARCWLYESELAATGSAP